MIEKGKGLKLTKNVPSNEGPMRQGEGLKKLWKQYSSIPPQEA